MKASLFTKITSFLAGASVLILASSAQAATISVEAISQGWYNEIADIPNDRVNTFTGIFNNETDDPSNGAPGEDIEHRSYFAFDVGTSSMPIESATLRLFHETYFSSVLSEEITLFDVETSTADLINRNESVDQALAIYDDLGSGSTYGSTVISSETAGWVSVQEWLEIELSAAAITDINEALATSGDFSVGISLTSLDGTSFRVPGIGQAEAVSFSNGSFFTPAQLVLEGVKSVPEPTTALGALAVFVLGLACQKRFKK
ncbi:MAG: hypothetical protein AAGH78_03380 [Cyanobacteria bacterium P01_H01_bin.58]